MAFISSTYLMHFTSLFFCTSDFAVAFELDADAVR